ncbi:MAG: glycerophosphodiester phosphodiesterase [Acidobacteria bacterium]|nr:glycerophosphodiester phosphodiesterase [Acidobacteriota bacterium]
MSFAGAAPRIQVHGHRGARALRPENSLPAFAYAIEQGVDVLEMDLAVTKDDILVVSHDPKMNPVFCVGPEGSKGSQPLIHSMTLAELRKWDCGGKANPGFPKQQAIPGTRVPTLQEVFDLVKSKKSNVEFNIETKISPARPEQTPTPERFAELVLEVVRKNGLTSRVILQSFDFRTLHAMSRMEPKLRLAALYPEHPSLPHRTLLDLAKAAGSGIVSPHFLTVRPEEVAAAHQAGLEVVPWTANEPAIWDKLIAAKVDAIISDDPAALIAYLKSKGLR